MSRGKTKAPTDPVKWRAWARKQVEGMKAEMGRIAGLVGPVCDALEMVDDGHSIDLDKLSKDVHEELYGGRGRRAWGRRDLRHWSGMMERVENSLQKNITACADRRAKQKTKARGIVDLGKLVRISTRIKDFDNNRLYAFQVKSGQWEEVFKTFLKKGMNPNARGRMYDLYNKYSNWGEPKASERLKARDPVTHRWYKEHTGDAAWEHMRADEKATRRARVKYEITTSEQAEKECPQSVDLRNKKWKGVNFHVLDRNANLLYVTDGKGLYMLPAEALETVEKEKP